MFILKVSRQETDVSFSNENILGPTTRRPVIKYNVFSRQHSRKEST
jgi:hypothetical protein